MARIQLRRGTAAEWVAANPTLAAGEMGLDTDADNIKIGDGYTAWNSLAFAFDTRGSAAAAQAASAAAIAALASQYLSLTDKVGPTRFAVSTGNVAKGDIWPEQGYHVLPVDLATGTSLVTLGKDNFFGKEFVAPADMVVTGMAMCSTGTVSAGLTVAKFALFHIGTRYNVTDYTEMSSFPIARTASDTTMFNSSSTLYSKSWDTTGGWPSSVRLVKGQRYAAGYIIAGTTAPTVVSAAAFIRPQIASTSTMPLSGWRSSGLGTLTDIPAYIPGGSVAYAGEVAAAWMWLACSPASTKASPKRTVLLGDSYFASYAGWFGYGHAQSGSPCLPVLNAGVGGETTTQMITRISAVTDADPDLVVIHAGINDLGTDHASAATVQANLTTLISACTAVGAKVVVCTIPPSTSMTAGDLITLAAVNTWIKAITTTNVYPADTGNALTTGDGVTRDAAKYTDGAHPNVTGQAAMGNVLDDVLAVAAA